MIKEVDWKISVFCTNHFLDIIFISDCLYVPNSMYILKYMHFYLRYILSFIFDSLFVIMLLIVYFIEYFDHETIVIYDIDIVTVILLKIAYSIARLIGLVNNFSMASLQYFSSYGNIEVKMHLLKCSWLVYGDFFVLFIYLYSLS